MARKIRIGFAGAACHVMARGNQGRDIYADDRDRKLWLATLDEAYGTTGWRIHAWVMMNNYYHLLLETPEVNLMEGTVREIVMFSPCPPGRTANRDNELEAELGPATANAPRRKLAESGSRRRALGQKPAAPAISPVVARLPAGADAA